MSNGIYPFTSEKDSTNYVIERTTLPLKRYYSQNTEISVARGDEVHVASQNDAEAQQIENDVVLPSPTCARRGIGKRFNHWLVNKIERLTLKKERYVSTFSFVYCFLILT